MDYIIYNIYTNTRVRKMCLSKLVITSDQLESTRILKQHLKSAAGFERAFELKNQMSKVTD